MEITYTMLATRIIIDLEVCFNSSSYVLRNPIKFLGKLVWLAIL